MGLVQVCLFAIWVGGGKGVIPEVPSSFILSPGWLQGYGQQLCFGCQSLKDAATAWRFSEWERLGSVAI